MSAAFKYIKLTIKVLFVLLIVGVYALLIFRMCDVDSIPDKFKDLYVDDDLIALYQSDVGSEGFIYQTHTKYNTNDDTYGYFSVASYVIANGADEVQVVFKYNVSTLERVAEDYGLTVAIDRNKTNIFEYSLVVKSAVGDIVYDEDGAETTEETVDYNDPANYTLERILPSKIEYHTAGRYNYVRCVFKGVDFDKATTLGLFCDINYSDDIRYEQTDDDGEPLESYATLSIYNYNFKDKIYKLTDADISAMAAK